MRLSWNEIRSRAADFAEKWAGIGYERGQTQDFYNEFFEIFGVNRRRVASFEKPVQLLGNKRGYIDLFWKGVLLVEQKSIGKNLAKAKQQAMDYFPGLKDYELPRFVLVSDFQNFDLFDIESGEEASFPLSQLPRHVEKFGFILGVEKRVFKDQDPVNILASELMGKLHDALEEAGYTGHDLEQLLVRLLFCLFADDTGIFEPRGCFESLIRDRTREDGSDVGQWLSMLFAEVLNKPDSARQKTLDEDLKQFPYVNGNLFSETLSIPAFTSKMRSILLEACAFSWDAISPAIFGALFQSVMDKKERRKQGAHYTTEKNILKLIGPLFMDELREGFEAAKEKRGSTREKALNDLHVKMSTLTFFDPACGCGNFLVISYRELRELELEILKALYADKKEQRVTDISILSRLNVDQFYGIEIGEFPARIAEVALWMMDHIMNNKLSLAFGQSFLRIPLKKSPNIRHGDALEMDWKDVLAPEKCSYIFGNPPFVGAKFQSDLQRAQVRRIAGLGGSGGTLDFVTAWFIKAGDYAQETSTKIAFVSTNSVTQGEQVAQLWPILFGRCALEIAFSHRTFAWGSDARGKAHVHVVIIGLAPRKAEPPEKRLFSYDDINGDPVESRHKAISPYLFDASGVADRHMVIEETSQNLCGMPKMITGSQPIDDGNYIFSDSEKEVLVKDEPLAEKFLHPYLGGEEYINGISRWILALQKASPTELREMPLVKARMHAVSNFRKNSNRVSTLKIADYPTKFNVEVLPDKSFLAVPENSSEKRPYIPIGWLKPPTIPSNKLRVILSDDCYIFGVLTSRMHMAWTRFIGGRIKSDFQYSVGVVYNTFPWPEANEKQRDKIRALAQNVLDVRDTYKGASLADLYDADIMKPDLRMAHKALDDAVDTLYRASGFKSDRERVEFLFTRYEALKAPMMAAAAKKPKRKKA